MKGVPPVRGPGSGVRGPAEPGPSDDAVGEPTPDPGLRTPDGAAKLPTGDLAQRLARVFKHQRKWAKRTATTCFRVYEKDIPDQPLIVDWYDGDAVVWTFDRTRNDTPEAEAAWLAAVDQAVSEGLNVPKERIWRRIRRRQKDRQEGDGQYHTLGTQGVVKDVIEGGLTFEVNLSDYLDTGLFLDHRPTRATFQETAAGKDVLNLFCYTGAFTCHAAAGKARSTVSVDLSNTYLTWAGRNLTRNQLTGPQHSLVRADVLGWIDTAAKAGPCYDLIICDPPTFSNSTAMATSWSVDRDQSWLLDRCHRLLRQGGTLYFSTNSRGFKLAWPTPAGTTITDISAQSVPEDFRNRKIHQCWKIVKS